MASTDAERFVAVLAGKGLTPFRNDAAEDVALVSDRGGASRPCRWLQFGSHEGHLIAWLAGTECGQIFAPAGWTPDRSVQHMSAAEAKERLEFIEHKDGVDCYLDKQTGKKVYVGRTATDFEQAKARHNELYQKARALLQGQIHLDDQPPAALNDAGRSRVREAITLLEEVVQINPANWPAMWLVGKAYQRLEDPEKSLDWFAHAHRVNPEQRDVAREASIAAMETGRPEQAVSFCQRALEVEPDNPGLQANLALALLFCERIEEARKTATAALGRDPSDKITLHISQIIDEVLAGTRPCPHHGRDLR
jgi:tetratricopeptide (TPR) repeat protein